MRATKGAPQRAGIKRPTITMRTITCDDVGGNPHRMPLLVAHQQEEFRESPITCHHESSPIISAARSSVSNRSRPLTAKRLLLAGASSLALAALLALHLLLLVETTKASHDEQRMIITTTGNLDDNHPHQQHASSLQQSYAYAYPSPNSNSNSNYHHLERRSAGGGNVATGYSFSELSPHHRGRTQVAIAVERVKNPDDEDTGKAGYKKKRKKFPITWLRNQYPFKAFSKAPQSYLHSSSKPGASGYSNKGDLSGQYSSQSYDVLDPNPNTWVRIPNRPTATVKFNKQGPLTLDDVAPPPPPPSSLMPVELDSFPAMLSPQQAGAQAFVHPNQPPLMPPPGAHLNHHQLMVQQQAAASGAPMMTSESQESGYSAVAAAASAAPAPAAPAGSGYSSGGGGGEQGSGFGGISLSFGNGRSISFGGGQGLTIGGRAGAIQIGKNAGGAGADNTPAASGYSETKGGSGGYSQQTGGGYSSSSSSSSSGSGGYGSGNDYVNKHPTSSMEFPRQGKKLVHANLDMPPTKFRLHMSPRVKVTTGSRDPLEKPGEEELTEEEEDIFQDPEPFPKRPNATASANETDSSLANSTMGNVNGTTMNTTQLTNLNQITPYDLQQQLQPRPYGYYGGGPNQFNGGQPTFDDHPTQGSVYLPQPPPPSSQRQQVYAHAQQPYGAPPGYRPPNLGDHAQRYPPPVDHHHHHHHHNHQHQQYRPQQPHVQQQQQQVPFDEQQRPFSPGPVGGQPQYQIFNANDQRSPAQMMPRQPPLPPIDQQQAMQPAPMMGMNMNQNSEMPPPPSGADQRPAVNAWREARQQLPREPLGGAPVGSPLDENPKFYNGGGPLNSNSIAEMPAPMPGPPMNGGGGVMTQQGPPQTAQAEPNFEQREGKDSVDFAASSQQGAYARPAGQPLQPQQQQQQQQQVAAPGSQMQPHHQQFNPSTVYQVVPSHRQSALPPIEPHRPLAAAPATPRGVQVSPQPHQQQQVSAVREIAASTANGARQQQPTAAGQLQPESSYHVPRQAYQQPNNYPPGKQPQTFSSYQQQQQQQQQQQHSEKTHYREELQHQHQQKDDGYKTYTIGNGGISSSYGGGSSYSGGGKSYGSSYGSSYGHGNGGGGLVPSDGFDQKSYQGKVEKFDPEAHDKRERSKVVLFLKPRISIHMANSSTTTKRPKNPQRFLNIINKPIFYNMTHFNQTNVTAHHEHDEEFIDPDLAEPMDVYASNGYGYGHGYTRGYKIKTTSTTKKPKRRTTTTTTTAAPTTESSTESTTSSPTTESDSATTTTAAPSSSSTTTEDSTSSSTSTTTGDSSSSTPSSSTTDSSGTSSTTESSSSSTTTSDTTAAGEVEISLPGGSTTSGAEEPASSAAASSESSEAASSSTTETTPDGEVDSSADLVASSTELAPVIVSAPPATTSTSTSTTTTTTTSTTTSTTTTTAKPTTSRAPVKMRTPASAAPTKRVTKPTTTTTTSTTTTTTTTPAPTEPPTEPPTTTTTTLAPPTTTTTEEAPVATSVVEEKDEPQVVAVSTTTERPAAEPSSESPAEDTNSSPAESTGGGGGGGDDSDQTTAATTTTTSEPGVATAESPSGGQITSDSLAQPANQSSEQQQPEAELGGAGEQVKGRSSRNVATGPLVGQNQQLAQHKPMLLNEELIDKLMRNRTLVGLMSSQLKRVISTEQMSEQEKHRIVRQVFVQMMEKKVDFSMNNVRLAVKTVSSSYRAAAEKTAAPSAKQQRRGVSSETEATASHKKKANRRKTAGAAANAETPRGFGRRAAPSQTAPVLDTALKLTSVGSGGGNKRTRQQVASDQVGPKSAQHVAHPDESRPIDSSGNPIVVVLVPTEKA